MEKTTELSNLQRTVRARDWASIPLCWLPPSQTNTSHNLYPHPNTNHRFNPKLPSAKHDNLASPPTTPVLLLPQNKTKTDNYHLCHIQNTIIKQDSGNYCVCFCMHSHKNVHGILRGGRRSYLISSFNSVTARFLTSMQCWTNDLPVTPHQTRLHYSEATHQGNAASSARATKQKYLHHVKD